MIPVLPPKHPRRKDECLNEKERLARGWKILSLELPQYLAAPPANEEEEEEDEMADLIHNFGALKRKRGASFKQVTDATLEVDG